MIANLIMRMLIIGGVSVTVVATYIDLYDIKTGLFLTVITGIITITLLMVAFESEFTKMSRACKEQEQLIIKYKSALDFYFYDDKIVNSKPKK